MSLDASFYPNARIPRIGAIVPQGMFGQGPMTWGPRSRAPSVASALAVLALAAGDIASAQPGPAPASRRGWLPPHMAWSSGATAAQRATAMATLRQLERILLAVPELADPDGFEIQPVFAGGHRPAGPNDTPLPNGVIRYHLGLRFFAPTKAIAGEGCDCISVVVNDDPPAAKHRGEGNFAIYIQADQGRPIPHVTEVHGELLNVPQERSFLDAVFAAADALPWKPVSREEFITTLIFEYEGKGGSKTAEMKAAFAKTPHQEWMAGAPERRRNRDETLRVVAQTQSAAEVAKLRETLEATEREVTDRLRQSEPIDRANYESAQARITDLSADLRRTLEQMSPTERRMPALVDNALTDGPFVMGYRLSTDAAPPTWLVRTPNYDFWRARRSPVEVRSIRVHIGISGTGLRPKVQRALWQTYQQLDWAAVNRLLDDPRSGPAAAPSESGPPARPTSRVSRHRRILPPGPLEER